MSNATSQQTQSSPYILALALDPTTLHRRRSPLLVAHREAPDVVCGIARRIGTGEYSQDLVVYRLMIRTTARSRRMLEAFFVLEHGIFYEYEHWKRHPLRTDEPNLSACA